MKFLSFSLLFLFWEKDFFSILFVGEGGPQNNPPPQKNPVFALDLCAHPTDPDAVTTDCHFETVLKTWLFNDMVGLQRNFCALSTLVCNGQNILTNFLRSRCNKKSSLFLVARLQRLYPPSPLELSGHIFWGNFF